MNMKKKGPGFYVGAVGALFAVVTVIIYFAMNSMFFTPWVVAGLIIGIAGFVLQHILNLKFLYVLSYGGYMFAFYHFLVLEVEYRMDTLVDPLQGFLALDGIFYVICLTFLICIIATIVASCMKQNSSKP